MVIGVSMHVIINYDTQGEKKKYLYVFFGQMYVGNEYNFAI